MILFIIILVVTAHEVGSMIAFNAITYEKLVVRKIAKDYIKKNIDPVIETKLNWYFTDSDKLFGFSSYRIHCTFRVGNLTTWEYIVVEDGQVNNNRVIQERLKEDIPDFIIKQQKRNKSIKELLA
jgi:hypothetical protein